MAMTPEEAAARAKEAADVAAQAAEAARGFAEQALKALPAPKFSGPSHPFAGDDLWR